MLVTDGHQALQGKNIACYLNEEICWKSVAKVLEGGQVRGTRDRESGFLGYVSRPRRDALPNGLHGALYFDGGAGSW